MVKGGSMPTIEISYKDLCNMVGKEIENRELENLLGYAKCSVEEIDGDVIKVKAEDTNRPDLWSVEGIAREIKGRLMKDTGLPKYEVEQSNITVNVDKKIRKIRPLIACAVVKNLTIDQNILSQIIQLQEKVAGTFGRNRKEVAIGIYDLEKIQPPIKYTTVPPNGIKFVPLDFSEELTPKEILEKHPKGKEFGHLLKNCKEYPILIDAKGNVLSLPPIINSNYTGKVTEMTKNVFIECTGFNFKFLLPALNVIVCALADRGGKIENVKIIYPNKTIITPDLKPKKIVVNIDYIRKISGLKLSGREICSLLTQARYDAYLKGKKIELFYPAYRQDIMHQRDVVEDVLISYGYNKIRPIYPRIKTKGAADKKEIFSRKVAQIMISLGFQEILSYILTNRENLFRKMNLKEGKVIEIANPISSSWSVFRNWLLPSLIDFYCHNKHVKYPQKIFEIGDVVLFDKNMETKTKNPRKLAVAISDSEVGYADIAAVLDALLSELKIKYKLKRMRHPSFIEGRTAGIFVNKKLVGIIGEIHPLVLDNWNLDMPVAAFEIDLDQLFA